MDLIWLLTKAKYENFDHPTPSSIEYGTQKRDTRTAQQIRIDLLKRLKGK